MKSVLCEMKFVLCEMKSVLCEMEIFTSPTITTATHVFHFCRGIERRVLGVLKTQISKPGTAEFLSACLSRIASANLALSIVLSPALLSAPDGPALLCFATR